MREFIVTIGALFAAALSSAAIFAAFSSVPWSDKLLFAFAFLGFSIFPAIAFGGMLFVIVRSFHFVRWWTAVLGGIAVGALVAGTFFRGATDNAPLWALCLGSGAISGFVFWVVWKAGMRGKARVTRSGPRLDAPSA